MQNASPSENDPKMYEDYKFLEYAIQVDPSNADELLKRFLQLSVEKRNIAKTYLRSNERWGRDYVQAFANVQKIGGSISNRTSSKKDQELIEEDAPPHQILHTVAGLSPLKEKFSPQSKNQDFLNLNTLAAEIVPLVHLMSKHSEYHITEDRMRAFLEELIQDPRGNELLSFLMKELIYNKDTLSELRREKCDTFAFTRIFSGKDSPVSELRNWFDNPEKPWTYSPVTEKTYLPGRHVTHESKKKYIDRYFARHGDDIFPGRPGVARYAAMKIHAMPEQQREKWYDHYLCLNDSWRRRISDVLIDELHTSQKVWEGNSKELNSGCFHILSHSGPMAFQYMRVESAAKSYLNEKTRKFISSHPNSHVFYANAARLTYQLPEDDHRHIDLMTKLVPFLQKFNPNSQKSMMELMFLLDRNCDDIRMENSESIGSSALCRVFSQGLHNADSLLRDWHDDVTVPKRVEPPTSKKRPGGRASTSLGSLVVSSLKGKERAEPEGAQPEQGVESRIVATIKSPLDLPKVSPLVPLYSSGDSYTFESRKPEMRGTRFRVDAKQLDILVGNELRKLIGDCRKSEAPLSFSRRAVGQADDSGSGFFNVLKAERTSFEPGQEPISPLQTLQEEVPGERVLRGSGFLRIIASDAKNITVEYDERRVDEAKRLPQSRKKQTQYKIALAELKDLGLPLWERGGFPTRDSRLFCDRDIRMGVGDLSGEASSPERSRLTEFCGAREETVADERESAALRSFLTLPKESEHYVFTVSKSSGEDGTGKMVVTASDGTLPVALPGFASSSKGVTVSKENLPESIVERLEEKPHILVSEIPPHPEMPRDPDVFFAYTPKGYSLCDENGEAIRLRRSQDALARKAALQHSRPAEFRDRVWHIPRVELSREGPEPARQERRRKGR